jgi:hypothetical protein
MSQIKYTRLSKYALVTFHHLWELTKGNPKYESGNDEAPPKSPMICTPSSIKHEMMMREELGFILSSCSACGKGRECQGKINERS